MVRNITGCFLLWARTRSADWFQAVLLSARSPQAAELPRLRLYLTRVDYPEVLRLTGYAEARQC